jgi:hypothetical protein
VATKNPFGFTDQEMVVVGRGIARDPEMFWHRARHDVNLRVALISKSRGYLQAQVFEKELYGELERLRQTVNENQDLERRRARLTLSQKCQVTRGLKAELTELFRQSVPDKDQAEVMALDRTDGPEGDLSTARKLADEINLLKLMFSKNHWENLVARQEDERQREARYAREAAARPQM